MMYPMRINYLFISLLTLVGITFSSCIKDEAESMESDIVTATIADADELLKTDPVFTTNTITFRLKKSLTDFEFAPIFTLSEGATVTPESGTVLNFSEPQTYTVTSQDGRWKKNYKVTFIIDEYLTKYSFENITTVVTDEPYGIYHEFIELSPDGKSKVDWTSGNQGYNILAETLLEDDEELTPSFYPTSQTDDGYIGKGVKLATKSTGALGGMFGSPIAAGNLYLGVFNLTFPAIKSTKFGIPFQEKTLPESVTGYFKYKKGDTFEVNNADGSKLKEDTWDAYAIVFQRYKDSEFEKLNSIEDKKEKDKYKAKLNSYLPGDHNFNDERIISIARISKEDRIETDTWTKFNIPFNKVGDKEYDPEHKEYMITIVFSASLEGDLFNGAVGSTLYIDEVEIVTNDDNEVK